MIEPTRIIAIRHGETAWNVTGRIQGQLDVPLNDKGTLQAQHTAQALVGEPVAAIYASDLLRAFSTAQAISLSLNIAVTPEQLLRERKFGSFENQTFAEISERWPAEAERWRKRDPDFAPMNGGESLVQFRARIVAAAEQLAARHSGQLIVLVAHGGVMDVLYRAATGQDLQAPRTWDLGNAMINRLLWNPESGFTLVGWADGRHLDGLALNEQFT